MANKQSSSPDDAMVPGDPAARGVSAADGSQTGEFTQPDPGGYSPAALVFLSFAKSLGHGSSA